MKESTWMNAESYVSTENERLFHIHFLSISLSLSLSLCCSMYLPFLYFCFMTMTSNLISLSTENGKNLPTDNNWKFNLKVHLLVTTVKHSRKCHLCKLDLANYLISFKQRVDAVSWIFEWFNINDNIMIKKKDI